MAIKTVQLTAGLKVGDVVHRLAELRESTAGDLLDAITEAESPVVTPQGCRLLASPALIDAHNLRRRIVRIGEHPGPLTLKELKALSLEDYQLLQAAADELDGAIASDLGEEAADRGRDAGAPG